MAAEQNLRQTGDDPRTGDRLATDASLRQERDTADRVIEVVRDRRHDADQGLHAVRSRADTQVDRQVAMLPEVSEKLDDVAGNLARAAESLSSVADSIKETMSPVDLVDNPAAVAERAADTAQQMSAPDHAAPEPAPETSSRLAGQLAEIAEGMAEVTATLAKERRADQGILQGQREHTDETLRRERLDTDKAVDRVLKLLERKEDERAAAERIVARRTEVLGIVSHDLRGPLMTIAGATALVGRHVPQDASAAPIARGIDTINRAVNVMERLIRDLLDVGSIEGGQLRIVAAPHDIRDLIVAVVDGFEPVAAAKSVRILAELPDEPIVALYDHHRIFQVLSNLVHNAVKFTPGGGAIRVRATTEDEPSGERALISVSDTGIGIPRRELRSIFERFRRLDAGERTGLGLGLHISLWIVEAHGGRIWAESEVGSGTTFHFTLPRQT